MSQRRGITCPDQLAASRLRAGCCRCTSGSQDTNRCETDRPRPLRGALSRALRRGPRLRPPPHLPPDAEEVVAEVFAVALRRRAELREPVLPWLLVVARNALANRARAGVRARDKAAQAAYLNPGAAPDHADALAERDALARAFATLAPADREALSLVAWEGLPL